MHKRLDDTKGLFRTARILLIRILQIVLIIFVFPNILLALIFEKIKTKNKKLTYFFQNYIILKEGVLEKDFPDTLVRGFKIWQKINGN